MIIKNIKLENFGPHSSIEFDTGGEKVVGLLGSNGSGKTTILSAIKYVDDVVVYTMEEQFLSYLKDYEVRFLGTDYLDGSYTGKDIAIDVVWLDRDHDYSTTKLKKDIYNSVKPL